MTAAVLPHRIGFLPAFALLLAGCTHMAKARQCRDLARAVNAGLDGIAASKGAVDEKPAALRKTADRYAELAKTVKRKRPTHGIELGKAADELSSLFKQTSDALRSLADANEKKRAIRADLARRRLDNLARSEKSQAARLDSLCNRQ